MLIIYYINLGTIDLEVTNYTGLNLIQQYSSTEESLYVGAPQSVGFRSTLVTYTTTNQTSQQMYQIIYQL
jgi:hypothetical protein